MPLTGADVRRWLEGFEAAGRADREAKRQRGPRPQWSIGLALSLIESARPGVGGRPAVDPRRAAEDETVRLTWNRLRRHFLP